MNFMTDEELTEKDDLSRVEFCLYALILKSFKTSSYSLNQSSHEDLTGKSLPLNLRALPTLRRHSEHHSCAFINGQNCISVEHDAIHIMHTGSKDNDNRQTEVAEIRSCYSTERATP